MSKVEKNEKAIENYVNTHGFVTTEALANYFDLTPQTIRRYTKLLSDKGLANRAHGGVSKLEFNGNIPVTVNPFEKQLPLRIESLSLVCFEPIKGDSKFTDSVDGFLRKHTRIEPVVHIIIETVNNSWASSEADKLLRKIDRKQVAIFCQTITDTVINVALIARKRSIETYLIYQETAIHETSNIDLLRAQNVAIMSFQTFKDEWKYARV